MNRFSQSIWGRIYFYLNTAVIILILIRFFTPINFGGLLVYMLAALLIIGLLDSNETGTFRQNMFRHIFDLIILILFASLYYG